MQSYRTLAVSFALIFAPLCAANAQSSWSSMGNGITGKIAIITNRDASLQAFARGYDNALWTIAQTGPGGTWGSWQSIGGVLVSYPVAVINGSGLIQVFVAGSDHAIWSTAQGVPGGDSWTKWTSFGGYALGAPAAITNNNGSVEVFAVGGDNAVWHNWSLDPAYSLNWNGWSTLGGSVAGNLAAVEVLSNSYVLVFGTGMDNALWVAQHPNNQDWLPFLSLGGVVTSDPGVSTGPNGSLYAFVRGTDNAVWYKRAQGTPFTFDANWSTLGGTILNGPSAAEGGGGLVSVFVEGADTALWTITQPTQSSWE